jgi:hypothetical protein
MLDLPPHLTIEEACNWLHDKTGKEWILPNLIESGLNPYFWLDYSPEWAEIFAGRTEGYLTRMVFQGDLARLETDRGDALVTVFTAYDLRAVKADPGLRVPLSELRFKRKEVEQVAREYAQHLKSKTARNSQGRYTIAEAAQVLADAHGLEPDAFIERRMLPAIAGGLLHVMDPADGGPLIGRKCNVYADEVTPAGIDAWLSADGFPDGTRWPETTAISAAPPVPGVAANAKRWTSENLTDLQAYREAHTMQETAAKFGISEQRIRQLLPKKKPKPSPFDF